MQNENVKEDTNSILLPKNGKRKKFLKSFFHQKKVTSERVSLPLSPPLNLLPKLIQGISSIPNRRAPNCRMSIMRT